MNRTATSLAIGFALAGVVGIAGQSPGPPTGPAMRTVLVTSDSALHLQAWRPGTTAGSLEPSWEARPRSVDPATWAARRGDALSTPRDAALVIADINGDGTNELVAGDALGLTVYGRQPAYYPFATAADSGAPAFAIGDVDGDGTADVVTQRRVIAGTLLSREIMVLHVEDGSLRPVWTGTFPGFGSLIAVGDVLNDRAAEIVSAGETTLVLTRQAAPGWSVAAQLPNIGPMVGALRIGDVDRDGRAEIVAGGTGGKVTVYRYRKTGTSGECAVLWQSRFLAADGLTGPNGNAPTVSVQTLAIGDVTGDGSADIVAAAIEYGKLGEKDVRTPRVHVFSFDGARDFTAAWTSDWLTVPSVSAIAVGDLDADGANEFVLNGRVVYRRHAASASFRATTACASCTDGVIGVLGDLAEPVAATRLVPLYWNVPGRQIAEGQTLDVALTVFNPFAEAKDVEVTVAGGSPRLAVKGGALRIASVPSGGTVTLPPFSLTAREGSEQGTVRFDIAASGGYRQSVAASLLVAPPLPTYQADAQPRLADALAHARHDNRRVLIVWGTNAGTPSQDLILTMVRSGELARTLLYDYDVVRMDPATNARLAATYRVPRQALPHLTVLDAGGALLASIPVAPFKAAGQGAAAWDGPKLNEALAKLKPVYVDAQPVFTAALSQAKKEGKSLFLWFNAPW